MTPKRLSGDDPHLQDVLDLLNEAFAYMEDRIDPPSSLQNLTVETLAKTASKGNLWTIGEPPLATAMMTPRPDRLYLGKLAVAASARGQGYARKLIDLAKSEAKSAGLPCVRLETRIELTENHRTFERLGFIKTGESAHPGFDRPTSITMELRVS